MSAPTKVTADTAKLPLMLTALRLPTFANLWPAFADRADREGWPAARFLAALAELELAERDRRRIQRHLREARLPMGKTLESFDFAAVPTLSKAHVMALAEGDSWLAKGNNILAFGPPGGGKSHLAAALGHALIHKGYRVLFTRTTDLVQRLQTARQNLTLAQDVAKLDKFHLLILDDLSYAQKDHAETSVLFELIAARYERRSIMITANQPFGGWDGIFPDNPAQPFRLGLDHVENLLAERPDQLAGIDRADAPDHAGAEILLDALDRGRLGGAHEARLELLTVGAVVDPLARGGDPLPRSHHGGMADHGHQVAMPPRLRPQDAEAVLQVVEGDALDQTGQDLPVRGLWMLAGAGFHDVPSAGAVSNSFTRSNCRARAAAALSPAMDMPSSSAAASSSSRRRHSARGRYVAISSGVNMPRTLETNCGSACANPACSAAASAN